MCMQKSSILWFHVGKCKSKSPHSHVSMNAWGNRNIKDLFLTLSYCEIFVFSMLLSQMTRFTIIISVAIV